MPIKIGDKLREMKYVQAVAPVLLQFSSSGGVDVIYGIDPQNFRTSRAGSSFSKGTTWPAPTILDGRLGRQAKKPRWEELSAYSIIFHVAGIVEHGKGARLFVPIGTLQDLSGSRDKASIFFLKCTRSDQRRR